MTTLTPHPNFPTNPRSIGLFSQRMLMLADRYRRWIFTAIIVIYLAGFNGQWRPEPDSALYLTLGRNLAEGRGYTYHGEPHHLAYPGLPWLWALVFKASAAHAIFIDHALMLLMGLVCLALCYRLFLIHADRPTAVFITLGLAISRMFYRYCFELRSDIPFLLGVLAFLCGFEVVVANRKAADGAGETGGADESNPRWFDWVLLVGGLALAVVMRPTMWAVLAAAVFASIRLMIIGKARWAMVGIFIVATTLIGFLRMHGQYEQAVLEVAQHGEGFAHLILTQNLPGLFEPAAAEAMFGLDMGPGLNTLGSIAAMAIGLSLFRRRALWGFLYSFTVLMMLAVLPLDRYFLPVLPLLVYGWWRMLMWVDRRWPGRRGRVAFVALFLLGSGTNFVKVGKWIFDQHQRPLLASYKEGKFANCLQLGKAMEQTLPPNAWIISPERIDRIMTFYSRRNVTAAGRIDSTSLQALANVDRAYVLNPEDETVKQWLATTQLRVGAPIISMGNAGPFHWTLCPILRKHPQMARGDEPMAIQVTGGR
jgi:hypothetical protein